MHSVIFFTILFSLIAGNLLWWRRAHRMAGRFVYARVWRVAIGLWCGSMAFVIGIIILSRIVSGKIEHWVPQWVIATVFIWHLLFALEWLAWRAVANSVAGMARLIRRRPAPVMAETFSSRRQFLTAAAIVTPPTLAMLAGWRAVNKFDEFRINAVTLRIPNLPPALAGLRIAHVTDIHIGKFTDDPLLRAVVERTNALRPDLILYTGDLIDYDIADLPAGLAMMKRWDPKFGTCVCEGNHDLMSGRYAFEQQVTAAGFEMPINSSRFVTVRGQPIQLLGLRWGSADPTDDNIGAGDRQIAESVHSLIPQLQPGAFPILLAHHPHAFDYLGDSNINLVLAGHTHGGQINIGPIHPARMRFRYISGLYQHAGRQLYVNNGVGNWFPLRINAPAEIVDITLQPA